MTDSLTVRFFALSIMTLFLAGEPSAPASVTIPSSPLTAASVVAMMLYFGVISTVRVCFLLSPASLMATSVIRISMYGWTTTITVEFSMSMFAFSNASAAFFIVSAGISAAALLVAWVKPLPVTEGVLFSFSSAALRLFAKELSSCVISLVLTSTFGFAALTTAVTVSKLPLASLCAVAPAATVTLWADSLSRYGSLISISVRFSSIVTSYAPVILGLSLSFFTFVPMFSAGTA